MRRFLGKAITFAALQAVILSGLLWRSRSDNADEFLAACIDKHQRAASLSGPRVLLVGGSNVAFGVDSPELERRLGLPVVNLGLHASLGLEFMLREAEALARDGDRIILSPEYEQFLSEEASPAIVLRVLEHFPEGADYLTPSIVPPFLDQGLPFLHKVVRRGVRPRWRLTPPNPSKEANNPYFRRCFNAQGDVVAHHTMTPTYKPSVAPAAGRTAPALDRTARQSIERTIARINRFVAECRSRNIQVDFSHPPRAAGSTAELTLAIQAIDEAIQRSLSAPILTKCRDLILDDSHFFDTCYHPAASGKTIRTRLLWEGIERAHPSAVASQRPVGGAPASVPRTAETDESANLRR